MNKEAAPSVVLAAGTCTGAGTTVALVEACRTLSSQLADGRLSAVEVHIPADADEARKAAQGCTVRTRSRAQAIVTELFDRSDADIYIGFADRLPLNRRAGSTRVMVVQNPHLYESTDAPSLGSTGRRVRTWWASRSAESADLIVCATNASRDAVVLAVGDSVSERIDVRPIRPATPPARTEQSVELRRFVLLGDLYSYKRFEVALDGIVQWATSHGSVADVSVVHCGRVQDERAGAGFAAAVQRARAAGIDVVERGAVAHAAAMDDLLASDVLVSASEVETQGLTILEAMAVGVPVVARAIGPVQDLAGDAIEGVSVDGAAADFASAIAQITDQDVRIKLVERGLSRAQMDAGWNLLP